MAVTDAKIHPNAGVALLPIKFFGVVVASQTNRSLGAFRPPFKYEVVKVEVVTRAFGGTITVDARVGLVSVLEAPIEVDSVNPIEGTLVESRVERRGAKTARLDLVYTSAALSSADEFHGLIWIRPYPLNGES